MLENDGERNTDRKIPSQRQSPDKGICSCTTPPFIMSVGGNFIAVVGYYMYSRHEQVCLLYMKSLPSYKLFIVGVCIHTAQTLRRFNARVGVSQ